MPDLAHVLAVGITVLLSLALALVRRRLLGKSAQ